MILKQNKIEVPSCVLNIGGISNITIVGNYYPFDFTSRDIGPGNCLIDAWIRKKIKKRYDDKGLIAKTGKTNAITLDDILFYFNFINDTDSYSCWIFCWSFWNRRWINFSSISIFCI